MNQNQNSPFEVNIKNREEDICRIPDKYIDQLLHDTHAGKLLWHKSRFDASSFEHSFRRIVVCLTYEIVDTRREKFTLTIRKCGDMHSQTMVAQHIVCIETSDELKDLWHAIKEYIECEQNDFAFNHMERYVEASKRDAFADELCSIVETACRDIIDLVKEQNDNQ